jgi:hypothetical protein
MLNAEDVYMKPWHTKSTCGRCTAARESGMASIVSALGTRYVLAISYSEQKKVTGDCDPQPQAPISTWLIDFAFMLVGYRCWS